MDEHGLKSKQPIISSADKSKGLLGEVIEIAFCFGRKVFFQTLIFKDRSIIAHCRAEVKPVLLLSTTVVSLYQS